MTVAVKICGLTDSDAVESAIEGGVDYLGFVFFESSPRFVTPSHAAMLIEAVPETISCVGLFVDPTDSLLVEVLGQVRLDYIQLHGSETPDRVDAIRLDFGVPIIKALGVSEVRDIEAAAAFSNHADLLLFDAKPSPEADRPGGNAKSFDWSLMKSYPGTMPWLLAGGLTSENVVTAIARSGAPCVDVSTGVESRPGHKDPSLISAFLKTAKSV
ncbi:MAG: phosphoribosylanthranilate isomerase [Rhodospirillaceae bacterium]